MTVVSVLVALLLLGILITVHEFGHYIFARMTGIEVMEFAIGFGPKIVGWTGKSGTKFALRCIPLGGYCAFYGEDDVEGKATNDPRAFGKQPVWKRMLSVLMGPGMNFLLPLVVLVGCRAAHVGQLATGVAVVLAGMPMGGTTTILAEKYGADSTFASKCTAISTVLSLITTPLWCLVV